MTQSFQRIHRPGSRWACSILLCLLLSGCNLLPGRSSETVQEPPLIPEPATDASLLQDKESGRKPLVLAYADLMDFNDLSQHHPKLHEAVSTAIRLGILKPANLEEKFEPQNPIRYGEFRQWAIAYQGAATGMDMLPVSPPQEETTGTKPNTPKSAESSATSLPTPATGSANPMSPINLMILPSELQWSDHRLAETRVITREELCAIYTFLSRQDSAARALRPTDIEAANPQWKNANRDALNLDEALSQFKDYPSIGDWARRYVAIAYRDGMLQKTLGLTPSHLTIDDGLNPQREVTREEAIVLLHGLFSQAAADRQTLRPTQPRSNNPDSTTDATSSTSGPVKPTLPATTGPETPMPVSHRQTVQEKGPNGSRSAIRVSGPD